MNFKPTLLKTILVVIISLIVYFFQEFSIICDSLGGCDTAVNSTIWSLIIFVASYIVWSLFQKK